MLILYALIMFSYLPYDMYSDNERSWEKERVLEFYNSLFNMAIRFQIFGL